MLPRSFPVLRLLVLPAITGIYADAVRNAESQQARLRMTVAGFDTEAAGLVNALSRGGDAMAESAERARELGVILEDDLVRQAAELESQRK